MKCGEVSADLQFLAFPSRADASWLTGWVSYFGGNGADGRNGAEGARYKRPSCLTDMRPFAPPRWMSWSWADSPVGAQFRRWLPRRRADRSKAGRIRPERMSFNPSGLPSLNRRTPSRSVWRSMPPIRAACPDPFRREPPPVTEAGGSGWRASTRSQPTQVEGRVIGSKLHRSRNSANSLRPWNHRNEPPKRHYEPALMAFGIIRKCRRSAVAKAAGMAMIARPTLASPG